MAVAVRTISVPFLFLVCLWTFITEANQFAVDCSFGDAEDLTSNLTMSATFKGRLAASKYLSHSCIVRTDGQSHQKRFLQVKAKLVNNESNGKHVCLIYLDISSEFFLFLKTYCSFCTEFRPTTSYWILEPSSILKSRVMMHYFMHKFSEMRFSPCMIDKKL